MEKERLLGKNLEELQNLCTGLGFPRFSGKQIAAWLYDKQVISINEMSNLSLKQRETLHAHYTVGRTDPVNVQTAADGTRKYLYRSGNHHFIEAVYIPDNDRATLCISCQVGCKMNCSFCMTGRQGFKAHLTAGDILNQIISLPERKQLTNLVYMGMGEPLDNLTEVLKSMEILTAGYGFGWSPKRITLSTIGIKKEILHYLEATNCHLAISLHSPVPAQRASLMPIEKSNPITEIIETLRQYDFSRQRRLSFEYIMFKEFNDSPGHAKELVRLLKGLDCRINLIRFHRIPDSPLEGTDPAQMEKFRDFLTANGIFTTIRKSRGEEIAAACGMLATSKELDKK